MQRQRSASEQLVGQCLAAFVDAGSIEVSLDELANRVGISKRMLIHYFGGRDEIEERAMTLLEDRLRARFSPESFPPNVSAATVVKALWARTTSPESKGVLLLIMDLSRRAWSGSARARAFYEQQQRLWVQLLMKYIPHQSAVEELLQLFQGAVLAYLITGDPEPGRRSLLRLLARHRNRKT